MNINYKKAILAGVVGTLAFDLLGLALTGTFWDIPALLNAKLFDGSSLAAGVLAHYSNGILLSIIYSALAPSLPGGRYTRALTYVTAETVFGVWLFMLPLLGAGVAGLKMGWTIPVISLARHLVYGLSLATLTPDPTGAVPAKECSLDAGCAT